MSLLERAVSLLPNDDPARRDITLKLGIALAETGQLSRADALLHDRIEAERRGRSFVVFHDGTGKRHVVDLSERKPAITVGRRPDNDVSLSWDNEVSRRHAELIRVPGGWMLEDDGSRNGSFRNGQRITDRRPLRDGDVLRFGDTVVLYRSPSPDDDRGPQISEPDQVTSFGQSPTHGRESSEVDPE